MDQGGCRRDHQVVEITTMPGGAPASTSRWNPTKEQITMLENLYRQGIRTPTAEQIQEITGTLQAYGHIEGKNVFYWFQNHKARQRQKQKQENDFAYLHRYLNHQSVPPLFPPPQYPYPNVCGPYYVPQPELGFYTHQFPKVLLPGNGIKKNYSYGCTGGSFNVTSQSNAGFMTKGMEEQYFINGKTQLPNHHHDQETLELFPMHPTGILKPRTENPNYSTSNAIISSFSGGTAAATSSSICKSNVAEKCSGTDPLYFDFFSGN